MLIRVSLLTLVAVNAFAQAGDWVATVAFEPDKLHLALHVTPHFTAMADSVDQDLFSLPVTRFKVQGRQISFAIPRLSGRFSGTFAENAIDGRWIQHQGGFPMRFERGNLRPQEPAPPYPYDEQKLVCHNGAIRLAGTLTSPRDAAPHPAVVLLTGSGPQDRNDTVSGHRPFLVWADYLTRRGFAVLRMDDRGVGGSSGKLLDSTDEDFAADALAAVDFLSRRRDIDPRRIGLLGHSEGAVVAAIAAARSMDIAFVVLLAGPALPGDQILAAQSERIARVMGIPDDVERKNREIQQQLFTIVRRDPPAPAARREMESLLSQSTASATPEQAAVIRGQIGSQISTAASRWFRFVLSYDPAVALAKLACPVLALYGSLDLQVPPELNVPAMKAALAGNQLDEIAVIPELNHMLQHAGTGSPVEYTQIEETVAPEVLKRVGDWMAAIR